MDVIRTVAELRRRLAGEARTACVLTMGNLHEGHLALVREAARHGQPVVVTIFVNRLQFRPTDDFERYPRTLDGDLRLLGREPCDVVFAPDETEMYPEPQGFRVTPPPELAEILEGASRPGFFTGVSTVVLKLFSMIGPRASVFGKKDYQQVRVIEAMCRQLALPITIVPGEIRRAPDGLALSSRNGYLSVRERAEAPRLHRTLREAVGAIERGQTPVAAIEAAGRAELAAHGWQVDYIAIRRRADLRPPGEENLGGPGSLVVLGAATLGTTRLIDNIEVGTSG